MNVRIRCPNPDCGASFSVLPKHLGRTGRCRQCGAAVPITVELDDNGLLRRDERQSTAEPGLVLEAAPDTSLASSRSRPVSRPRTPPTDLPEQFGRFRILGRLGRGGMGSVYKAYDSHLHRQVALKIPHLGPEDGPEVLERFYREAQIAATFDHPNLCPVYTVDHVDGVHYLAMPLLEGQPLSKCLDRSGPLPQRPVAALVRMVALAMEEAHRRGVVHRDLKPSNIMADRQRVLVIVDFGLSLRSGWLDQERRESLPLGGDERITRAGSVLGTPAYMAPEQVDGGASAIGPSCDIYSLGVILYEFLTGHLPFEGPTAVVLGLIKVAEPPRPSALRPDLKLSLEAICLKAMANKPGDRFASMGEFAASLKVFLDHGEYTQAGIVPAGLLQPKLLDDDVPTTLEQQLVDRLLAGPDQVLDVPALEPRRMWTKVRRILAFVAQGSRPKARQLFWLFLFAAATMVPLCLVINQYLSNPFRARGVRRVFGSSGKIPPGRSSEAESGVKKGERELVPKVGSRSGGIITPPDGVANGKARLDAQRGVPGELRRFGPGNGYWLNRVAFSPDERHVIAGGGAVIWYDLESRREELRVMEVVGARSGLALASDGRYFLTAHTNDPVLRMADVVSGREVQLFRGHSVGIVACALSPNGLQAVSAGQDGTLWLWNVGNGTVERRFTGDAGAAMCVAFLSDGRQILSGHKENGGKHAICLWDAETGERRRRFDGHFGPIHAVAVLPDSGSYVSASEDGTVRRWELESGMEMQNLSHQSAVHSVAVSPDGRRVLSSEWGNAPIVLHLWELSSGREIHRFLGHTGHVLDVVFSGDNRLALSSDTAGFAILFALPTESAR